MDPFTLISGAIGLIGLGTSLFGGHETSHYAQQAAQINQQIAGKEQQVDDQRRVSMEINARRQQLENIRNTQRARSMALSASVNQGAQYGTGIAGGLAQVQNQGAFNALGVQQQLGVGENIFDLNKSISGDKINLAGVQGQMATSQGISAMGGSLMGASQGLGRIFSGFGGSGGNNLNWGYMNNPSWGNTGGFY